MMAGRPAPSSPRLPAGPPERRWLPSLGVLAVILAVVFGGYVTAAALSTPAGPPVSVGGVVRVSPLSGWAPAARFDNPPGIRLTRGSGNLDLLAALPFSGTALDLSHEYVDRVLTPNAERLSVSRQVEEVRLRSGLTGIRVFYVGAFGRQTPIEGEVTAVVSPSGVGIVFDGWAPGGRLQYVVGDIRLMIESAEIA
ncbi:MAG: hypothetical protein HYU54_05385 [Actinobacteria bacterium]|nr:hypothetical protein [Actinomycetota bacterium]